MTGSQPVGASVFTRPEQVVRLEALLVGAETSDAELRALADEMAPWDVALVMGRASTRWEGVVRAVMLERALDPDRGTDELLTAWLTSGPLTEQEQVALLRVDPRVMMLETAGQGASARPSRAWRLEVARLWDAGRLQRSWVTSVIRLPGWNFEDEMSASFVREFGWGWLRRRANLMMLERETYLTLEAGWVASVGELLAACRTLGPER